MLSIHREHHNVESTLCCNLLYCKECGCITYKKHSTIDECVIIKNKTTIKPVEFSFSIDTDPFAAFQAAKEANLYHAPLKSLFETHSLYLSNRIKGINVIKFLSIQYDLDEKIYHSSIYLLDLIYLQFNYVEEIKKAASICLILVSKFYDSGHKGCLIEDDLFNKNNDHSYSKSESLILQLTGYNLNFSTAYDILSLLLYNGIVFEDDNIRLLNKVYIACFIQLNNLIEKQYIANYSPYQIAFSIVTISREIYGLRPRYKLFAYLYILNVASYSDCLNCIKSKIQIKKAKLASIPNNAELQHEK